LLNLVHSVKHLNINGAYYLEIMKMKWLQAEAVRRKRPELWLSDGILRHYNVTAHKAPSVKQFLAQKSITEMLHPPLPLIWLRMTWGSFQKYSLP
jgi:hypothetical protein